MSPPEAIRATAARLPLPPANIAGMAVAVLLHRVHPWPMPGPRRIQRPLGRVLIVAGALVAAWAAAERPEADLDRPQRVTTTGPYRFSRNPMYLGWHLSHLGAALSAGSNWGLLTLAAAVVEVDREIRGEEREMVALFGADFEDYAATVPRYCATLSARAPRVGGADPGDPRLDSEEPLDLPPPSKPQYAPQAEA